VGLLRCGYVCVCVCERERERERERKIKRKKKKERKRKRKKDKSCISFTGEMPCVSLELQLCMFVCVHARVCMFV